jgi:peptide/nickel transport system substrate-binding protein
MKHKVFHTFVPVILAIGLVWGLFNLLPEPAIAKESATPVNADSTNQGQAAVYKEAPMLAAMVAAGQLPPVEARLPVEADIVVIEPVDGVGLYGGTWHNVSWWEAMGNIVMILYDPPIRWKADYSGYEPGLLKSWDISTDGTTLTWHFREGLKWSDGMPFTSEDLQFWWEDLALNESVDMVDVPWWGFNADGSPMTVTFPTSMTMIMNWDQPNYIAPYIVAQGYWEWLPMERPKHFLSPYHPDYNPGATYEELENMLYGQDWLANGEGYPCLHAWCLQSIGSDQSRTWVRNPYYWKVDTDGNQLPYIDYIHAELVPDEGDRLVNLSQGKYEASFRGSTDPNDIADLQANAASGDYLVWPGAVNGAGAWPGWIVNQNFNDQENYPTDWEEIGDLLRDQNFRQGLSHAMDRDTIIDVVWDGDGTPQQATISPQSWHFNGPQGQAVFQQWANSYVTYNTSQAEVLFAAANFTDQDEDGWRDLPSGTPFTLTLDMGDWSGVQVSISATHEMEAQLEALGIRVAIIDLIDDLGEWDNRQSEGLFMLKNCHAAELDLWTYPDWVFPVRDNRAWPMEGKWYQTGGSEGWEPQPGSPAYDLQALYRQGLAEPDEAQRHEIVWEAIDIHIQQGPFTIGASGDQAMPFVIRNGFHGVPADVVLGPWAPGSPGNLHSEQFWMDKSLNPDKIYLPLSLK